MSKNVSPPSLGSFGATSRNGLIASVRRTGARVPTESLGIQRVEYRIWGAMDQDFSARCMAFVNNYFLPVIADNLHDDCQIIKLSPRAGLF
jgi:hypothetical protein